MTDLRKIISEIDPKFFFMSSTGMYREIEAHSDDLYIISNIHIETLRDEFYGHDRLAHIRENDGFVLDKKFIKDYFLKSLNLVEIIKE